MDLPQFFTESELQLLFNKDIFHTKRTATEKLYVLFSELQVAIKDTSTHKSFPFPAGTDYNTGKISKGENYKAYPYVILDFPKLFNKNSVFAFRSMFWFGNSFTFSFVCSGNALHSLKYSFLNNRNQLHQKNIFFSLHETAWQHELNSSSDILIENVTENLILEHIRKNDFIKLTSQSSSTNKENIISDAVKVYEDMLRVFL